MSNDDAKEEADTLPTDEIDASDGESDEENKYVFMFFAVCRFFAACLYEANSESTSTVCYTKDNLLTSPYNSTKT